MRENFISIGFTLSLALEQRLETIPKWQTVIVTFPRELPYLFD